MRKRFRRCKWLAGLAVWAATLMAAWGAGAQEGEDFAGANVGKLSQGDGKPSADKRNWPQFRGPNRDAIVPEANAGKLYRAWPAEGPKVLWSLGGLGPGYGGPAVCGGKVYFEDYDKAGSLWMMRCVSLADGKEIWRWSYKRLIRVNHGITRAVPVADERYVVTLDPKAVLHGFDAATGKRLWAHDLVKEFGTSIPEWYSGECLLGEPDRVIVGVGGKEMLMAAFEKATGKVLWQTPNPENIKLSHSSVVPMKLCGQKQYVWCTMGGLFSVDPAGKPLWRGPVDDAGQLAWKPATAVAPSAVALSGDRVFMTSSYNVGSVMFKVGKAGDTFVAKSLFTLKPEQFASDCQTPIVWKDHVFAVQGQRFACMNADGKVVWTSPEGEKFGLGPFILADGLFFLAEGDSGKLHAVEASTEAWKEVATAASIISGHEVWSPMAVVNGKMVLRDMNKMVCIEVGKPNE
ncbi:MAG: PQQ-like beta-propeller repeat protein [Phycisphaerae bacterium]|nr:PQQ-like beta-propeller repeat protein [Phycisphaerae bacterium]